MNTIKDAQYLMDNYPDTEVTVFYIDLRAYGKGFEELLMRTRGNGVRYVRGLPGDVREDPRTRNLILTVENTSKNASRSMNLTCWFWQWALPRPSKQNRFGRW